MKFKVGDKVKCIEDQFNILSQNGEYVKTTDIFTISNVSPSIDSIKKHFPNSDGYNYDVFPKIDSFFVSEEIKLANSEIIRKKLGVK